MTKPARKLDPLDARTLRWVTRRLDAISIATRDQLDCARIDGNEWEMARYEGKIDALQEVRRQLKTKALESRQPRKLTPATTLCGPVPKRGKR